MPLVLLEARNGVAKIQLNRPDVHNAISPELLNELESTVREASNDPDVRVIVFSGNHRAFSTGADLKTVAALFDLWPRYIDFVHRLHDVFCGIEQTPIPTIAAVRGYALAGGLELILCCDLAVASCDARIGDQHANYGLMAGAGGIPRLVRRVGLQRALEIFYTGRWLTGTEAAAIGIALRAVPDADLDIEAEKLAAEIASKSRSALMFTKRAARMGLDLTLEGALQVEHAALIEYFTTSDDPRQGLNAFMARQRRTSTTNEA